MSLLLSHITLHCGCLLGGSDPMRLNRRFLQTGSEESGEPNVPRNTAEYGIVDISLPEVDSYAERKPTSREIKSP